MSHKRRSTDDLQGEGNYAAARQYDDSVRDFVKRGKVRKAAREASPDNSREQRELEEAEKKGLARARGQAGEGRG